MKENPTKKKAERGVAQSFLRTYNDATGRVHCIVSEGESPDFTCQEKKMKDTFGLEITAVYYGGNAARGLWNMIRGREDSAVGVVVNPEHVLSGQLNQRLNEKWRADYGSRCVLVAHVDAPLTTAAEFDQEVLPHVVVPREKSPFQEVYVRLAGKNEEPKWVWWQLYPEKLRLPW